MNDQKNTVPHKEGQEATPTPLHKNQKPGDEKQSQKATPSTTTSKTN